MSRSKQLYYIKFGDKARMQVWVGRPVSFKTFLLSFIRNLQDFKHKESGLSLSLQDLTGAEISGPSPDYEQYPELTGFGEIIYP